jgi:DNA replication protein DnaC
MSTAVARNLMADMKLLGVLGAFDQVITEATRDQSSYTELLDALLQAEADYRQERKTGYRIKAAKFTLRPAFEDIDFTASRSISKAQIKELYSLQWLHEARPVLLIGQASVGKTFIAQAAGLHACACGKSVLYMTLTTWLENLALARSSGTYLRYRDKLVRPDLVIIDDFGMRKLSATEAQDLCELLEERSINKSTLFSTQLPLDHWSEVIADPVIADAIRDRLEHSALAIHITGESYRGVKARNLPTRKRTVKNRRLRLRRQLTHGASNPGKSAGPKAGNPAARTFWATAPRG